MSGRLSVAVLFGGRSAEHDISLQSAQGVLQNLDTSKYHILPLWIDPGGGWYFCEKVCQAFLGQGPWDLAFFQDRSKKPVCWTPTEGVSGTLNIVLSETGSRRSAQVVFPLLHGSHGEDGTLQGLLEIAGVPYVGASVLGSAIGMDKEVSKRLLKEAGLPIVPYRKVTRGEVEAKEIDGEDVFSALGSRKVIVKPAGLGSSVGISVVAHPGDLKRALEHALLYDSKVLVEEYLEGRREIECAVLGHSQDPQVSLPGEIITNHEFYDYEAKYVDTEATRLVIPAELPTKITRRVQDLAREVFRVLCGEGMGRVDFFIRAETQEICVNEINTIPGFTSGSMFPKLWAASGIPYPVLLDFLIQLAMERSKSMERLHTHR